MTENTRWTMFADRGEDVVASWRRNKAQGEKRTDKPGLQQWENEGGNAAPAPPAVAAAALPKATKVA